MTTVAVVVDTVAVAVAVVDTAAAAAEEATTTIADAEAEAEVDTTDTKCYSLLFFSLICSRLVVALRETWSGGFQFVVIRTNG